MKRRMVCCLLVLLLAFGCAPAAPAAEVTPVATEAPAPTEAPTPTLTPEPTPEPVGVAPIDLFSAPYNVFADIAFPAGYTVYGARYDCAQPEKGLPEQYMLLLTAEGDKTNIVRYFAGIVGITDEATLTGMLESIERDGFLQIDGSYNGLPAIVQLKQTEAGFDNRDCVDVDGCRVELSQQVDAAQSQWYLPLMMANLNTNVFGELADRFPNESVIQSLLSCYVNIQKPELTEFYPFYQLEDAAALETEIASKLKTNWHDEQTHSLGLSYGRIECGLRFNLEQNTVRVDIRPNDNGVPAGTFVTSEQSLTKLGFQYYPQDGLAIYEDKSQNLQVAIAHPDWHHVEDWNVLIFCEYNKHNVMFQYFEKKDLFMVTAESGDHLTGSNFDLKTNSFDAGFPDAQEMQTKFTEVLGSSDGDLRERMLEVFTNLLQERFGMTWQALYALPVW